MMILALDFLAAVVLTGFVLFGLLIPLSSLWSEFLPHAVQLLDPEVLAAAKITVIQAGLSASISLIAGILLAMSSSENWRGSRAPCASLWRSGRRCRCGMDGASSESSELQFVRGDHRAGFLQHSVGRAVDDASAG